MVGTIQHPAVQRRRLLRPLGWAYERHHVIERLQPGSPRSIDSRLRDQIDRRVDKRVDESLASRLSVIERAIADLDRAVKGLQQREDETGETEAD